MKNNNVLRLTESALMVATATLLSIISLFRMPQGGEVTLCATMPLVLIGYRYGLRWGTVVAFVYSVIQLLLGLGNLSYAANVGVAVVIVLFDYIVPYTLFGLSGAFRTNKLKQTPALCLGLLVCSLLRYACHVVSGYFVWSEWAEGEWLTSLCQTLGIPDASNAYFLVYSMGYNSFVFVDMAIAMVVIVALSLILDLRREGLPHFRRKEG